jgi:hypothetical protein
MSSAFLFDFQEVRKHTGRCARSRLQTSSLRQASGRAPAAQHGTRFSTSHGDYFRWQHMWPRIAKMFEMEIADPVPMPLSVYMADKGPVWDATVQKYDLQSISYEQVASWAFGDAQLHMEFDNITSTIKARRAGFHDCIDTEEMFASFFDDLRRRRVIPALN